MPKQIVILCVIVGVAVIGAGILMASHAATPFFSAEAENGAITAPAVALGDTTASGGKGVVFKAATTTTPPPASGSFSVSGGKVIGPDGKAWHGKGMGIYDRHVSSGGSAGANTILGQFPGANLFRIANYNLGSPASYAAWVNTMTAAKAVVVFEHHDNTGSAVLTGSTLANESNWYASLATYYKNNPYVMFGSMNEPGTDDSPQMAATYNAIRGTGSNAIIFMEAGHGGNGEPNSLTPSVFSNMKNVGWDIHSYNWQSKYNTDPNTITADMNRRITGMQAIHSGDGIMPCISLELGNSTNGKSVDAGGVAQVDVTYKNPNLVGAASWIWSQDNTTNIDNLTLKGSGLTAMGQQVKTLIQTVQ